MNIRGTVRKVLGQLREEGVDEPSLQTVIERLERDFPATNWRERKGRISTIKSYWKKMRPTPTRSPLSTTTPDVDVAAAVVQLDTLGRTLGWEQVRHLVTFLEQRKLA